ncbi:MAG: DUF3127 domain-containing protein [Bacteroidota bacterium]
MYTIKGTIKLIRATQQVSEKFRKREFVLTDNSSQYPQHISIQATQDKCDLLNAFNEGDEVEVGFYLRGREWQDKNTGQIKYFNSIDAFKISKVNTTSVSTPAENFDYSQMPEANAAANVDDDLPF